MNKVSEKVQEFKNKHKNEITQLINQSIKENNLLSKITDNLVFNCVKGEKLTDEIKKKINASDENIIVFGVIPDLILEESILIFKNNVVNNYYYFKDNEFTIYINMFDLKKNDSLEIRAESKIGFFKENVARLKFNYEILIQDNN
jgi:hypothetical protein